VACKKGKTYLQLYKTDFRQRFSENGNPLVDVGCTTDVSDIFIIPKLKTYVWGQCVQIVQPIQPPSTQGHPVSVLKINMDIF
jgi:hypothetical protein